MPSRKINRFYDTLEWRSETSFTHEYRRKQIYAKTLPHNWMK